MVPSRPLFSLVAPTSPSTRLLCRAVQWDHWLHVGAVSIVLLSHVIRSWWSSTAQWGHWLHVGVVSIVLSFHVIIGWVIDQVTLMMIVCLFVCSCLSFGSIKVLVGFWTSPPSPPFIITTTTTSTQCLLPPLLTPPSCFRSGEMHRPPKWWRLWNK